MDNELREQPAEELANVSIETEGDSAVSEAGSQNNDIEYRQVERPDEGEFGKFKSASALLEAYTNLQAEFTKKCQKLSQLEKDKTEETVLEQNLEEQFSQFLSKNGEAAVYADEIKDLVESDPSLQKVASPFDVAWAKVVLSHVSGQKASDPIINRYILSSDEIKQKVVENYLDALKGQNSPIIISSQKGERVSSTVPDTPTSLKEAKARVEKLFS